MNPRVRALVGVAAYALLVLVAFPIAGRQLEHMLQLVVVLGFGIVASKLERRPFAAFGLPWREAMRSRFWSGALVGIVSITVLVLALCAVGGLELHAPAGRAIVSAGFG